MLRGPGLRNHHTFLRPIMKPKSEPAFAARISHGRDSKRIAERMSKLTLLGAAAVLSSVLAGPAMAQRAVVHSGYYAQGYCQVHEPGNPYTPQQDYIAWSAWRSRGGWDDHNDWKCVRGGRLHHRAAGF
jgi:hypothetical protein